MKKIITTLIVVVSAIGFGQNDLYTGSPFPQDKDLPVVINNVNNNTQVNNFFVEDGLSVYRENLPVVVDRVWSSETRFIPSDWQTPTYRYNGSTEEFLRDIEQINTIELKRLRYGQSK